MYYIKALKRALLRMCFLLAAFHPFCDTVPAIFSNLSASACEEDVLNDLGPHLPSLHTHLRALHIFRRSIFK